jgi:nucleoside 2-deoxyribosyltransferase
MSETKSYYGRRSKVYLAGPLFSEAEQAFNELVTHQLEEWAEVYLPQRDGGLMSEMLHNGVAVNVAARRVFQRDLSAIREADYVITILDGRAIDEGVGFELGVAFALAKRCIGLQTDSRRLATWGNNPMITGALEAVFHSVEDLVGWFRDEVSGVSQSIVDERVQPIP